MNQDIKTKWVEALRSGEYRQGRTYLRIADEFCCLGVLADICGVESELIPGTTHDADVHWFKFPGAEAPEIRFLPVSFRRGVELDDELERELIQLNDGGYCTFNDIANVIEKKA